VLYRYVLNEQVQETFIELLGPSLFLVLNLRCSYSQEIGHPLTQTRQQLSEKMGIVKKVSPQIMAFHIDSQDVPMKKSTFLANRAHFCLFALLTFFATQHGEWARTKLLSRIMNLATIGLHQNLGSLLGPCQQAREIRNSLSMLPREKRSSHISKLILEHRALERVQLHEKNGLEKSGEREVKKI
jgi:hypothetical protein